MDSSDHRMSIRIQIQLTGLQRLSFRYDSKTIIDLSINILIFQYQPINARQAFPCYDEIRYRTPFDIEIFHHESYNALSNMDVLRVENVGNYSVTIFNTSPPMPTFQVSFTISNFDHVRYDQSVDMRVYARPNAIALGQADEALALGYIFLNAMVVYFGFPYVLPKSFQVALPEFSSEGTIYFG